MCFLATWGEPQGNEAGRMEQTPIGNSLGEEYVYT